MRLARVVPLLACLLMLAGCSQVELLRLYVANEGTPVRLAQSLPVTLPFREDNGWIIVPARVGGSAPVDFVLDTGASMLVLLVDERARGLPLDMSRVRKLGAADDLAAPTAAVQRPLDIDFGPLVLERQTVLAVPRETMRCAEGTRTPPFTGVIGHELFSRYVVEVDYDRHVVVLHDPDTFVHDGAGEVVPLDIPGRQPYLVASVQGPDGASYDARLHVDSGAGIDLSLFPQTDPRIVASGDGERSACFVGGATTYRVGSDVALSLGGLAADVPAAYSTGAEVIDAGQNGRLGSRFLRRFNLVFDYPRGRMILERRESPVPDEAPLSVPAPTARAPAEDGGNRS